MRIQTGKLYVLESNRGISGFQDWLHFDLRIVSAETARYCRTRVLFEFDPSAPGTYRLDDGHLPDYQPRTDGQGVLEYLSNNPYSSAYLDAVCEYGPNDTIECKGEHDEPHTL
jgi:hypothetical protein